MLKCLKYTFDRLIFFNQSIKFGGLIHFSEFIHEKNATRSHKEMIELQIEVSNLT